MGRLERVVQPTEAGFCPDNLGEGGPPPDLGWHPGAGSFAKAAGAQAGSITEGMGMTTINADDLLTVYVSENVHERDQAMQRLIEDAWKRGWNDCLAATVAKIEGLEGFMPIHTIEDDPAEPSGISARTVLEPSSGSAADWLKRGVVLSALRRQKFTPAEIANYRERHDL